MVGQKKLPSKKAQTSFNEKVKSRTNNRWYQDEDVFESDEEDSGIFQSIVDDNEDSSDWLITDSGKPSVKPKHMFQRVSSRLNPVSRRSLLTTSIHQPARVAAIGEMTIKQSKSSPVLNYRPRTLMLNGPSIVISPEDPSVLMANSKIPRSKPTTMTPSTTWSPVLSPRATHCSVLAAKLTGPLDKDILWEHQANNATTQRRDHPANNMVNIQRHSNELGTDNTSKNGSWKPGYFDYCLGDYHEIGW